MQMDTAQRTRAGWINSCACARACRYCVFGFGIGCSKFASRLLQTLQASASSLRSTPETRSLLQPQCTDATATTLFDDELLCDFCKLELAGNLPHPNESLVSPAHPPAVARQESTNPDGSRRFAERPARKQPALHHLWPPLPAFETHVQPQACACKRCAFLFSLKSEERAPA